ncbi:uncharacterized protein LOC107868662 [Capsicum annuum]|uniref:uncharacterized protein LOC107868662 n=1 Tax=Capsicum annuum TaxID=4072 RepID=UPI0007BF4B30|nr:uncharacterized protein LOC107868662 [Capsicum annuum]
MIDQKICSGTDRQQYWKKCPKEELDELMELVHRLTKPQGGKLATARIRDFMWMSAPEFYRSKTKENPQFYLEKIRKITQVMHLSEEDSVKLASYRLKDITYDWVVSWKNNKGENVASVTWQMFQDAFLDKFFPLELREAKIEEFINLRQGSMTIKEYCLKFNQFAKYSPDLISNARSSMSKFVTGIFGLVLKECRIAMLYRDMDLSRLMIHDQ